MAQKLITVDGVGLVTLQKRRGNRSIRLSIAHDGSVKVSMPSWSPYQAGAAFVRSKIKWINEQQAGKSKHILKTGQQIGKAHHLQFVHQQSQKVSTRVVGTSIVVRVPLNMELEDPIVQSAAHLAATRALKHQAQQLLPRRLQSLATEHGFSYKSVSIKQLKARWGSCSSHQDIALNLFLMQLPWELIDYVLLHELTHTKIMAHGPEFWAKLSDYVPNLSLKRAAIKKHQPAIIPM